MFELFDQFIYISIILIGAYLTLYRKSRAYAGILLIVCSLLSNLLLFKVVMDPYIAITLPITAILLIADCVEDFRLGAISHKHKLGACIGFVIICYSLMGLVNIAHLQLIAAYKLMAIGSGLGVITGIYLITYPVKQLMIERKQNINQVQTLTNEEQKLIANQEDETVKTSEFINNEQSNVNRLTNKYFYVYIGLAVVIVVSLFLIAKNLTQYTIDMTDYIFVHVKDTNSYQSKVKYYASFENFDESNNYELLQANAREYGLDESTIEKYTPNYTLEQKKMWKGLDISVNQSPETVKNGDVVVTNISYNQKYAHKHNIVLKNTSFETEITNLKAALNEQQINQLKSETELIDNELKNSKHTSNYDLANATLTDVKYYLDENSQYQLIVSYKGHFKSGLLGKVRENISFELTPYYQNQQLKFEEDIKVVNSDN